MKTFFYRLNALGWIGAVLFVIPTPVAIIALAPKKMSAGQRLYQSEVSRLLGPDGIADRIAGDINNTLAVSGIAATATLIGLVLLLIGREIVAKD